MELVRGKLILASALVNEIFKARDMVFLAARGWTAIGVDYLEKLKVRAMNLARRAGVTIGRELRNIMSAY